MKLLILDENYPHVDNLMGDVFVHVRAKEYNRQHTVKVFSFFHSPGSLVYEGIALQLFDSTKKLLEAINNYKPDKILIHFYQFWMLEGIIKKVSVPVIIWVHGYEALGWYRRLFNYTLYSPVLFNYIRSNTRQQFHFRKLIKYANSTTQVSFVFVSAWMKKITEADTLSRINNCYIIPNPIDTHLFQYREKEPELRKKILLLRSFGSRKYANDIAAEAIQLLAVKPLFKELQFTIIGTGGLFKSITTPLAPYHNVKLQEKAIRQKMIPALHQEHGIFICPTRQDAQGVSMCEAMSSGLVPVTSNNTAIPEFILHLQTGFTTNNAAEVAAAIELMYHKPDLFVQISQQAAISIRQKCSLDNIIKKELSIIEN